MFVSFALYNASGLPYTGLSPSFDTYKDFSGQDRSPPSIVELGGGLYGFEPTQEDIEIGVAYEIDCGSLAGNVANPERVGGSVSYPYYVAFSLYDSSGVPLTGLTPVFDSYKATDGSDVSAPTISEIGGGLYGFSPSDSDVQNNVAYEIDCGVGAYPERIGGYLDSQGFAADNVQPQITNFVPSTGSVILPTDSVGFDVTENSENFRRVMIIVDYSGSGQPQEVIHNGDSFLNPYYGTRTAISGGFRYSISRTGGWTASPYITPFAIDTSGNENL